MIIGIDIMDLQLAHTGQRTTLEEICREFQSGTYSEHQFHYFQPSIPFYTGKNKLRVIFRHIRFHYWKQIQLPLKAWRKKCDIVYCNDFFAPLVHLNFKVVQIFHDASFYEHPELCNPIWLRLFRYLGIPAAKRSSFIIAPTNYAKNRIHQFIHLPIDKLITIYQAPKTLFPLSIAEEFPAHLRQLLHVPYILHVGVFEKRKNLPALIRAYKLLREAGYTQYKLVLVGKGNDKTYSDSTAEVMDAIQKTNLEKEVILTGYLSDKDLALIYARAFMYVFPSVNEGFGIPILEAFRFGLPVLVANNTCLPEVGGDAVLTFNPFNDQEICAQMKAVIDDPSLRQSLIQKGQQRLTFFSWKKTAAALLETCKKALE
jgi:glycosyltransferase involved in cell wall biosynthesis